MKNVRLMRLSKVPDQREAAKTWLAAQSANVQRVTAVRDDGSVVQGAVVDPSTFVDRTAQLFGGMIIGQRCYIGPFAVIRLDEKPDPEPLIIGDDTNLQDFAVVHSTTQHIGARVIVAHQAIVHGARLEDDVTLYIQAVADGGGTVIGAGSFLHQGSYVGKGLRIAEGRYVEPGRKVLTQAEADALPPVPDALKEVRAHVMELNAAHVNRYLSD